MKLTIVLCLFTVLLIPIFSVPVNGAIDHGCHPCTPIQMSANSLTLPSPLKQIKTGISVEDIKCNVGLQLIGKREDGYPACVTSNTFSELILRGWGYDPTHELSFDGLNDTYKIGQKIDFGISYKTYRELHFCSFPVVVAKYENQTVWQSGLLALGCPAVGKENAEYGYGKWEWRIGSNSDLGTMNLNKTGTYSIVVSWFKSPDIVLQKNIRILPVIGIGGGNLEPCPSNQYFDNGICRNKS